MKNLLIAVVFWALACPAIAQSVSVVSGNHAGFVRLVVLAPNLQDWRLGRVPGGYEMRAGEGEISSFDLSRAFSIIPRDRINSLEDREAGRLFIAVKFDCYAIAFRIAAGLVIDIREERIAGDRLYEAKLPEIEYREIRPNAVSRDTVAIATLADRHFAERTSVVWNEEISIPLAIDESVKGVNSTLGHTAPEELPQQPNSDRFAEVRADWSCHAFVPLRLLTYAAFASKAKGLFQPSAECLRRGL